jgi:hypothetical protein
MTGRVGYSTVEKISCKIMLCRNRMQKNRRSRNLLDSSSPPMGYSDALENKLLSSNKLLSTHKDIYIIMVSINNLIVALAFAPLAASFAPTSTSSSAFGALKVRRVIWSIGCLTFLTALNPYFQLSVFCRLLRVK